MRFKLGKSKSCMVGVALCDEDSGRETGGVGGEGEGGRDTECTKKRKGRGREIEY